MKKEINKQSERQEVDKKREEEYVMKATEKNERDKKKYMVRRPCTCTDWPAVLMCWLLQYIIIHEQR